MGIPIQANGIFILRRPYVSGISQTNYLIWNPQGVPTSIGGINIRSRHMLMNWILNFGHWLLAGWDSGRFEDSEKTYGIKNLQMGFGGFQNYSKEL